MAELCREGSNYKPVSPSSRLHLFDVSPVLKIKGGSVTSAATWSDATGTSWTLGLVLRSGAVLFAAHRPSYSRLSLGVASWEGDLLPKTQAKLIAFDPRFGERAVVVDESGTSVHLVELATLTNSSMNDNEGAVARSRQQFCREQSAACLFPVLVYATASPQQDDRITAIVWWQNEKKGQFLSLLGLSSGKLLVLSITDGCILRDFRLPVEDPIISLKTVSTFAYDGCAWLVVTTKKGSVLQCAVPVEPHQSEETSSGYGSDGDDPVAETPAQKGPPVDEDPFLVESIFPAPEPCWPGWHGPHRFPLPPVFDPMAPPVHLSSVQSVQSKPQCVLFSPRVNLRTRLISYDVCSPRPSPTAPPLELRLPGATATDVTRLLAAQNQTPPGVPPEKGQKRAPLFLCSALDAPMFFIAVGNRVAVHFISQRKRLQIQKLPMDTILLQRIQLPQESAGEGILCCFPASSIPIPPPRPPDSSFPSLSPCHRSNPHHNNRSKAERDDTILTSQSTSSPSSWHQDLPSAAPDSSTGAAPGDEGSKEETFLHGVVIVGRHGIYCLRMRHSLEQHDIRLLSSPFRFSEDSRRCLASLLQSLSPPALKSGSASVHLTTWIFDSLLSFRVPDQSRALRARENLEAISNLLQQLMTPSLEFQLYRWLQISCTYAIPPNGLMLYPLTAVLRVIEVLLRIDPTRKRSKSSASSLSINMENARILQEILQTKTLEYARKARTAEILVHLYESLSEIGEAKQQRLDTIRCLLEQKLSQFLVEELLPAFFNTGNVTLVQDFAERRGLGYLLISTAVERFQKPKCSPKAEKASIELLSTPSARSAFLLRPTLLLRFLEQLRKSLHRKDLPKDVVLRLARFLHPSWPEWRLISRVPPEDIASDKTSRKPLYHEAPPPGSCYNVPHIFGVLVEVFFHACLEYQRLTTSPQDSGISESLKNVTEMLNNPSKISFSESAKPETVEKHPIATKWVASGNSHSLCSLGKGELVIWGCVHNVDREVVHLENFDEAGETQRYVEQNRSIRHMKHLSGFKVLQVCVGRLHNAVLTDAGVFTFGSNCYGQLCLGPNVLESPIPAFVSKVVDSSGQSMVPPCIIDVTCGQHHTLAVSDEGSVFTCGWNIFGQLGHGDVEKRSFLTRISAESFGNQKIREVHGGYLHSLFVSWDRTRVFTCGSHEYGQLGIPTTHSRTKNEPMYHSRPVEVAFPRADAAAGKRASLLVVQAVTGIFDTLVLCERGSEGPLVLFQWGKCPTTLIKEQRRRRIERMNNRPRTVRQHSDETPTRETGKRLMALHRLQSLRSLRRKLGGAPPNGMEVKKAIESASDSEGSDSDGEAADSRTPPPGDDEDPEATVHLTPSEVKLSQLMKDVRANDVLQFSIGRQHAAFLLKNGSLYMWGQYSTRHALKEFPTLIPPPRKGVQWAGIQCGNEFTIGVDSLGQVWAWGAERAALGVEDGDVKSCSMTRQLILEAQKVDSPTVVPGIPTLKDWAPCKNMKVSVGIPETILSCVVGNDFIPTPEFISAAIIELAPYFNPFNVLYLLSVYGRFSLASELSLRLSQPLSSFRFALRSLVKKVAHQKQLKLAITTTNPGRPDAEEAQQLFTSFHALLQEKGDPGCELLEAFLKFCQAHGLVDSRLEALFKSHISELEPALTSLLLTKLQVPSSPVEEKTEAALLNLMVHLHSSLLLSLPLEESGFEGVLELARKGVLPDAMFPGLCKGGKGDASNENLDGSFALDLSPEQLSSIATDEVVVFSCGHINPATSTSTGSQTCSRCSQPSPRSPIRWSPAFNE